MILCGAALLTGCSLVDEDLSDCGADFRIDYQLRLVTNITTELESELGQESVSPVKELLKDYFKIIFTDYAKNVDLSFYDAQEETMPRLAHMREWMNGSESSYTLYLPVHKYRHTAVANVQDVSRVVLADDEVYPAGRLVQKETEGVLQPHDIGVFTARKDIDVMAGADQHFEVPLYMANAATALVLDIADVTRIKDLSVTVSGFATEFLISDSTYVFPEKPAVWSTVCLEDGSGKKCYVSVHFPSRPVPGSKVVIDDGGGVTGLSPDPLWHWTVHATLTDDSVTESVIHMYNPLAAGHLKVLAATVQDTGIVTTTDPLVGVSVTLDWHYGGEYPIDL